MGFFIVSVIMVPVVLSAIVSTLLNCAAAIDYQLQEQAGYRPSAGYWPKSIDVIPQSMFEAKTRATLV
jgi:hypothetical protein